MVQAPAEITDDDKLWALLSWLFWPIAIIVLLLEDKKQRPFIKYHAIQSLALAVVGLVISTVLSFVFIGCVTGVVWLIYAIYLAIKAYQGEWVVIPFLTDFCKNQGWI
ncbi:MAG TPA: DUF4870 domain-containing protein [Anaerolineales bacterium]|nr:DUF4870 domain-containing protein [Anaerolineales bacterium]